MIRATLISLTLLSASAAAALSPPYEQCDEVDGTAAGGYGRLENAPDFVTYDSLADFGTLPLFVLRHCPTGQLVEVSDFGPEATYEAFFDAVYAEETYTLQDLADLVNAAGGSAYAYTSGLPSCACDLTSGGRG